MKAAVLFSGGKDSCLALWHAMGSADVECLITMLPENKASYMFHTPNVALAKKQAEAIGLPIITKGTRGEKEAELVDLREAIGEAIRAYGIEAVFTGAIASRYQASRIKWVCDGLGIDCVNPLWGRDPIGLLEEVLRVGLDAIVTGVFAMGLEGLIGRRIDGRFLDDIKGLRDRYGINPAGEGGEFETFVLDAPFFERGLAIVASRIERDRSGGLVLVLEELRFSEGRSAGRHPWPWRRCAAEGPSDDNQGKIR
jgi:ABC transporter with metal-binding/Fe-S-binding domain ATP-binding protein